MNARRLALAFGFLAIAAACWQSDAWARKDPLLDVAGGQIPDDTGSDGATKMSIADSPQLGGKALKVDFAAGDSFGVRMAKVRNWKPYITLEFEAFNPEQADVALQFNVRHKRSTTYQTRVEHPLKLKPGKNAVKIGVDEMTNVNGSAPDLSDVQRWYINCTDGKARTLYFGDIVLVGDDAPPAAGGAAAAGYGGSYRVTGKVGEMKVELLVRPQDASDPTVLAAAGKTTGHGNREVEQAAGIRSGAAGPHPRGQDAADRQAGDVRHARGRRDPLGPGGLSARQPLEPGRRRIGRCIRTRRTSSPRSAPTSRCATTPTWASSSCRRTRSGST